MNIKEVMIVLYITDVIMHEHCLHEVVEFNINDAIDSIDIDNVEVNSDVLKSIVMLMLPYDLMTLK